MPGSGSDLCNAVQRFLSGLYLHLGSLERSAPDIGNPCLLQNRVPNLTCAASLGAQGLPHFSHDLSALSQGFAAGLLSAMSGQLGSQVASCQDPVEELLIWAK